MDRIAFLMAASIIAAPATAGSPVHQSSDGKSTQADEKLVCRSINTTGSRVGGQRVCKTRAQWNAESDQTREDFENAPRQPSGDQFTPNDPN
jgi:hypothetical protein